MVGVPQPVLEHIEQLLRWLEPRRVLRLEYQCGVVTLADRLQGTSPVRRGVVYQQYDLPVLTERISPNRCEGLIDEVLEKARVHRALDQLGGQHRVLGDGCDQAHVL